MARSIQGPCSRRRAGRKANADVGCRGMGGTSWANKAASGAERGFSRVTHVHEITRTCKYGVAGAEGAPVVVEHSLCAFALF